MRIQKAGKFVAVSLAASLLISSVAVPRRAEAIIATTAVGAGPVLMGVLGGASLAGGLGMAGFGCQQGFSGVAGQFCAFFGGAGLIFAVVGVIMLDAPSGPTTAFGPLSVDSALKLGVKPEAREIYNSELPEINAVRESVLSEADRRVQAGETLSTEQVQAIWSDYGTALSPESFATMKTVASQFAHAAAAH